MNVSLVGDFLSVVNRCQTGWCIIDQDVLFVQQVALYHIVGDLKGQHWVLRWVKLVDVDDTQEYKLTFERYFDL